MRKLDRLRQELNETESLLRSPRVGDTTRYVLERLRDDLKGQIVAIERGPTEDSCDNQDRETA